jgi:hypothetical protein
VISRSASRATVLVVACMTRTLRDRADCVLCDSVVLESVAVDESSAVFGESSCIAVEVDAVVVVVVVAVSILSFAITVSGGETVVTVDVETAVGVEAGFFSSVTAFSTALAAALAALSSFHFATIS